MRSQLVFAASDRVKNRFLLCRIVSVSARRLHKGSISIQESLNGIFELLDPSNSTTGDIVMAGDAGPLNGKGEREDPLTLATRALMLPAED
jgi:hypothetical protein